MGTALSTIEALPLPVLPSPTPKWPDWLMTMSNRLARFQEGTTDFWKLPALPTESQCTAIAAHRDALTTILQAPTNDERFAKQIFGLVTKLVLVKPSRAGGPETTEARIDAYMVAVDDLPVWAVDAAILKWHRGEHDRHFGEDRGTFDYRWAPESADLRKLAIREVNEVRKRIVTLDRVLSATPLRPAQEGRDA
jgi:hypothetical protein